MPTPSEANATDPNDTDTLSRDPIVCVAPPPCTCPKCSIGGATTDNTLPR